MRTAAMIALGLALVTACDARAETPPLSKLEARKLSPEAVRRRVLDQIGDILIEAPRPRGRPARQLSNLDFWTRPHSTQAPGLCVTDQVTVAFRAMDPDTGATTATRAVGISAAPWFRFLAPPASDVDWPDDEAVAAQDRVCARLDPTDWSFFRARDENAALAGGSIVALIPSLVASGDLAPICDPGAKLSAAACRDRAVGLRVQDISDVSPCWPSAVVPHGACTTIDVAGFGARVETNLIPGKGLTILKLELSDLVIIADELID